MIDGNNPESRELNKIEDFFIDKPELMKKVLKSPIEVQRCILDLSSKVRDLAKIGAALSAERNLPKLLQTILEIARLFTNADGGTLYMMNDDEKNLRFEIVQTSSLNIKMGGMSANPIDWYPVKLCLNDGKPNYAMVSAYVDLTGNVVNIPDVYDVEGFDFTGTRNFDKKTGYRSKSMLVVPMRNHEDEIIGVLQLINAIDSITDEIIAFSNADQELIVALASQAAVAITNTKLIQDLENLFESFIQVIASAIDEKSPYTGGHIQRVTDLTMMIANSVNKVEYGKYASTSFTDDQLKELRIAAWMHDIGKITTPEYIVDKATKLETIYDRIESIRLKYEILKRDKEIEFLKHKLEMVESKSSQDTSNLEKIFNAKLKSLDQQLNFLDKANIGSEFMDTDDQKRISAIGSQEITLKGKRQPLLSENEIENLCVPRGTLREEERQIINNHVLVTIKMLNNLPYPKKLRHIPEYAGAHHEKPNGTGYPKGLKDEQLSLQSKIMALADIFEALTAKDRPYKKGKTLSEAIKIMKSMSKDRHIDPELFKIFIREKIYLKYAEEYMDPQQIDEFL
jgi:HD-GYP domain-containing protein (c-di-GMP phosphodiesterase class II)